MSIKSKIISTAAAAISATLSLVAMNAHAGEAQSRSVTVRIEAFDLSKEQGAQAVYARLRSAARQVCRELESRELSLSSEHRECLKETLDDAIAQVDNAHLSALHRTEAGVRIASSRITKRS